MNAGTELRVETPGRYTVEVSSGRGSLIAAADVTLADGRAHRVMVPAAPRYGVTVRKAPLSLAFLPPVTAATLRRVSAQDVLYLAERPRVARRITLPVGDSITIRPVLRGTGAARTTITKAFRLLAGWGFGIATRNLQETPGLFDGTPAGIFLPHREPANPRIAVVVHLFYPALWPEFAVRLASLTTPFHLIVTTSLNDGALHDAVRAGFPDTEIVVGPNRGRDVGPFLQLLHDGRLDRFDLICKLHGKHTADAGHRAILGHIWRRASLIDLLDSEAVVARIVAAFDEDPTIGMIGSPRFRPTEDKPANEAWGKNRATTLALAARLGVPADAFHLDFYAGTMFWVRRRVLEPLKILGLKLDDFPGEDGSRDGQLHHACERIFGALPERVGQRLADATPVLAPDSGLFRG